MTLKEQLIKEIEQTPDTLLTELLDFLLFFKDKAQEWQKYLAQSLAFFQQVENRVGVQLDYSLLQRFLGDNFDF